MECDDVAMIFFSPLLLVTVAEASGINVIFCPS